MIINNVGEVVRWEPVPLDDNKVIFGIGLHEVLINVVPYWDGLLGTPEPDGKGLSLVGPVVRLLERDMRAGARVQRRLPGRVGYPFMLFQSFG